MGPCVRRDDDDGVRGAASRLNHQRLWNTGSPAFAGDDAKWTRGALLPPKKLLAGSFARLPSPGGGGSDYMSAAKCEPGWGDGLSSRTVPRLRDHPTPPLRVDPPPPGEGKRSRALTETRASKTRLRILAAHYARVAAKIFRPTKGVGNAGCRCTRSRACSVVNTRVSHHGYAETPGIPARNGVNGFLRALPGDRLSNAHIFVAERCGD